MLCYLGRGAVHGVSQLEGFRRMGIKELKPFWTHFADFIFFLGHKGNEESSLQLLRASLLGSGTMTECLLTKFEKRRQSQASINGDDTKTQRFKSLGPFTSQKERERCSKRIGKLQKNYYELNWIPSIKNYRTLNKSILNWWTSLVCGVIYLACKSLPPK